MKTNKNTNTNLVKKSYEENLEDDICNFNSYISDKSENYISISANTPSKNKNLHNSYNTTNNHNVSKKSRKNSISKLSSTKDSQFLNLSNNGNTNTINSSLFELVDSLKDKISLYENEIRNLIDEKVQMQMTINSLQMTSYSNIRKKSNHNSKSIDSKKDLKDMKDLNNSKEVISSNILSKSNDSVLELNKHFVHEASGLKRELKNLNSNIERQKQLLEQNESILDETIIDGENGNGNLLIKNDLVNVIISN
jgi:hypothetical protein